MEKWQIRTKLVQFSALQLPFHSASVEAFSSFIGLSSTRQGNAGYEQATSEIHRFAIYSIYCEEE